MWEHMSNAQSQCASQNTEYRMIESGFVMDNHHEIKLKPYLSRTGAWAFSLGTSIGWGSLVITSSTYLSHAGPLGSLIGMVIGTIVMLIISRSYHYMMNRYPDAGGAYTYAKQAFGHDYAFLTAWFLILTYFAILWANATSVPLFARYFVGDIFKFCKLYTVFGYDIYLGEVLLSVGAVALISLLCVCSRKIASWIMTITVFVFTGGIVLVFLAAIFNIEVGITPLFQPESDILAQIVKITCISTWAFIGFENISHFTEEFSFEHRKSIRVLRTAVISSALLYLCITLLSVTAYPPEYANWLEYIGDLNNLSGISALPAFYAARHYLGDIGVGILMSALMALIISSLIGNITALSRLLFALAKDRILPGGMCALNKRHAPWKTIVLIAVVSFLVPFVGRSAIGWVVDVTTLGATLIYGFVAASVYKTAKLAGEKKESRFGLIGMVLMIVFGLYLLVPTLFGESSLEKESYFFFIVWSILGLIAFYIVLKRDKSSRFGHSLIVWVALLSLTLFVSLVWMNQTMMDASTTALNNVHEYYASVAPSLVDTEVIAREFDSIKSADIFSLSMVVGAFILSLSLLIVNYSIMSRRARRSEAELGEVKTVAFTDPLTGVKSKHAYIDHEQQINDSIGAGGTEPFALAVCDVNGLKYINDTQGHKAGDQYIRDAAKMICDTFKHSPVYRIGGDEFVAVLRGHDYEHREELQQTLYDRSKRAKLGEDVIVASGVSAYEPSGDNCVAAVFERADCLMYENKKILKGNRAALNGQP